LGGFGAASGFEFLVQTVSWSVAAIFYLDLPRFTLSSLDSGFWFLVSGFEFPTFARKLRRAGWFLAWKKLPANAV
jgi:hypothetical protein